PLVRIKAIAVRVLDAIVDVSELGTKRCCARHGRVHMQPCAKLTADWANLSQRINCVRRSRSRGCAHEEWGESGFAVLPHRTRQCLWVHCKVFIHLDETKKISTYAGNPNRFLCRRVRLG